MAGALLVESTNIGEPEITGSPENLESIPFVVSAVNALGESVLVE